MAIQYDLRKNHLVDGPDVHRAQVIRSRTIHFDNLVNEIADMGNTLTAVDIRGVIIALDHLIGNALAKGENVILPFCSFASSIRGNFNGRNDDFDPERHAVHPVIKAGVSLRKLYRNGIVLEKVRHAVLGREIDSFIDRNTGSVNSVVTPGGMGELIGYGLKFDQDDTAQGIFFVSEDDVEYRAEVVGRDTASNGIFTIPSQLAPGTYHIEVRILDGDTLKKATHKIPLNVQ